MQRLIAFGLLFLTLNSARLKPTPELLTPTQMVDVLTDLELAKAMVDYYTDDEATASQLLQENARLVYESYNVTPDIFQESYQYYLERLEVMKEIYEEVIERLEELEEDN